MKAKLIEHFVICCLILLECFDILCIKVILLSVVGLGESKGRPEPSTNSPATDFPQENPSEVHVPTQLEAVPPKEVKEQETNHMLKEINKTFSSENAGLLNVLQTPQVGPA